MSRKFLFLSGEFRVTMPVVFENDEWSHTMSPSKLVIENGILRRSHVYNESLEGIIFYCDMDNKELERENLQLIIDNNIPCWPNPKALIKMLDRHQVLMNCAGFGMDEPRLFITYNNKERLSFPFVVKTGNSHRGIGKFLVGKEEEMPIWEGIATIEPYWQGTSFRLLNIGGEIFSYKYENDTSWIKNSSGAEVSEIPISEIPEKLIEHARNLTNNFDLEVAGLDYIKQNDGSYRFLEINYAAGLDVFDRQVECAKSYLRLVMARFKSIGQ